MSPRVTGPEAGSASVLAIGFVGVLVVVGLTSAVLSGAFVTHRRAQAAADLAALAGAAAHQRAEDACAAAARVATANGAGLMRCEQAGEDLTVEVRLDTGGLWGLSWTLTSTARAGPER